MRYFLVLGSCLLITFTSLVTALDGERSIQLIDSDNNKLEIGKILFTDNDDTLKYKINFAEDVFQDEFLSMRPFKCIHQSKQMICHLVYPYEKQGYLTREDFLDLEYDLLFLHKSPQEYGINAWNGLYYKLTATDNGFSGKLMEVDLNVLAAPPEDGILRPVTEDMLYEADPTVHQYPELLIE